LRGPNKPLLLIVSLEELHFENFHLGKLVIVNVFQSKHAAVILQDRHFILTAGFINLMLGSKIKSVSILAESSSNLTLSDLFEVLVHFNLAGVEFLRLNSCGIVHIQVFVVITLFLALIRVFTLAVDILILNSHTCI